MQTCSNHGADQTSRQTTTRLPTKPQEHRQPLVVGSPDQTKPMTSPFQTKQANSRPAPWDPNSRKRPHSSLGPKNTTEDNSQQGQRQTSPRSHPADCRPQVKVVRRMSSQRTAREDDRPRLAMAPTRKRLPCNPTVRKKKKHEKPAIASPRPAIHPRDDKPGRATARTTHAARSPPRNRKPWDRARPRKTNLRNSAAICSRAPKPSESGFPRLAADRRPAPNPRFFDGVHVDGLPTRPRIVARVREISWAVFFRAQLTDLLFRGSNMLASPDSSQGSSETKVTNCSRCFCPGPSCRSRFSPV